MKIIGDLEASVRAREPVDELWRATRPSERIGGSGPQPESARQEGATVAQALLVDAMADSQAHLHGKRYAMYGDPDMMLGLTEFLLELGAEPAHILATNGPLHDIMLDIVKHHLPSPNAVTS